MKLVCVNPYPGLLTEGKIYETDKLDDCGQYCVVADNGEEICFYEDHFNYVIDIRDNLKRIQEIFE
jgi:hypothetical protein